MENILLLLKELLIAAILPHHTIMRLKQVTRISIIIRQAAVAGMFTKAANSKSCELRVSRVSARVGARMSKF